MVTSRELLDSITAYQKARDIEGITRSSPPEVSVDELADIAADNLREFIQDTTNGQLGNAMAGRI